MPKNPQGFTLVELLIVMIVIGLLAAIAIPKFSETRERAYVSSMKSDLRNLATVQETYYSEGNNFTYSNALSALSFNPSDGVAVAVAAANASGWSATATHTASPKTCAIFYGDADPVAPATYAGVVACTT